MKQIKSGIPPLCCTLNISGRAQERLANMFKALGNPVRFEIVKFLVTTPTRHLLRAKMDTIFFIESL